MSIMNDSNNNTVESLLQAAKSDLASVSRVFHRLASLQDAAQLSSVLEKLLPRLLKRLGDNAQRRKQDSLDPALDHMYGLIHTKLTEMMSHILQRVRLDVTIHLPCVDLLKLLVDTETWIAATAVDPFTKNLSLTFLTIGVPRYPDLASLLPYLLVLRADSCGLQINQAPQTQSRQILHMLLRCLAGLSTSRSSNAGGEQKEDTAADGLALARQLCEKDHIASAVYSLLLDVLLYSCSGTSTLPPPGLSFLSNEALRSGTSSVSKDWAGEMALTGNLAQLKLAILEVVAPSRRVHLLQNSVNRTLSLLVVATGDSHGDVADRARLFLKMYMDAAARTNPTLDTTSRDSAGESLISRNALPLSLELIQLALGQSQADVALSTGTSITLEGDSSNTSEHFTQQQLLSTKRRPLESMAIAAALSFLARLWQDFPSSLDLASSDDLELLATLSERLGKKLLLDPSNLSTTHNKAMIATAQVLESLTVRLTSHASFDAKHIDILAAIKETVSRVLEKAVIVNRPSTSQVLDGSLTVRDSCYLVLSHLARSRVCSSIMTGSVETAKLLFTCAAREEERVQPMAVAALDALLSAYTRIYGSGDEIASTGTSPLPDRFSNPWASNPSKETVLVNDGNPDANSLARSLLPLLWTACQPHQPKASRIAAARWAEGILMLLDLTKACHLLCFLAGDSDVTAASVAREGLGLTLDIMEGNFGDSSESKRLPNFSGFCHLIFDNPSGPGRRMQHFQDFSWNGKAASLRFVMICLMSDLYGGDDVAVTLYVKNLVETLSLFRDNAGFLQKRPLMDLLDVSSGCFAALLETSMHARMLIVTGEFGGFGVSEIQQLVLKGASALARRRLAEALGFIYRDTKIWGGCKTVKKWLEKTDISKSLETCCSEIILIEKNHFLLGPLHGSLQLGSQLVRAIRFQVDFLDSTLDEESIWGKITTILSMLAKGILHPDDVVANASADCLAVALSFSQQDAPPLHPRLSNVLHPVLLSVSEGMKKYKDGEAADAPRVTKLVEAAGICLAATTSHDCAQGNRLGAARKECLEALMSLLGSGVNRKQEEIALHVGEALGLYSGCYDIDVEMSSWDQGYSEEFANHLQPHEHALYLLLRKQYRLSNPLHRTACAPALLGIVGLVARGVNRNPEFSRRPIVKATLYALGEIQSVFLGLLSDPKSKHIARESSCLGIAACHGILKAHPSMPSSGETTHSLSVRLLHAFGQTTNHGGSAYQETPEQAARRRAAERGEQDSSNVSPDIMEPFGFGTEAGGTANMGEAALGAYREMAAASVALGRPEVLYDLLLLSVSHSIWYTVACKDKYGPTALLGGGLNQLKLRSALQPHLGKLLPKILRACNDPNKQTREQMQSLLAGLTGGGAETRKAISIHFIEVIDILLRDSASRFWRARVGACGALSDVIVGRDWVELGGGGPLLEDEYLHDDDTKTVGAAARLLRLWRAVVRALDDIRDAVRKNGESMGRSVRALTLRLCDPSAQSKSSGNKRSIDEFSNLSRNASAAAATSLRWLVEHGLNQRVPETQGLCVSTLVDIIGIAKPSILEPSLPDLIRSLLLTISNLEPAALNYLQLRTSNQESLERARLQLAQSSPLSTAVNKCVELLPNVKAETQQAVVVSLDTALRLSSGFASRAAVADTASIMCNTCPSAFIFPNLSGTSNPSVRLMRAFFYAAEKETGQGAKDKMTHALGNIAAFCPGGSVRALAVRACRHYRESTGTHNDSASRISAAGALRSIVVRATKQLSDGGNSNVWSQTVLPIAFLGQKDEEKKVASLMKEVWDEGASAVHESISQEFATRVEEAFLPELVKECVRALGGVSWSRRVAGSKSLAELCTLGVLSPIRTLGNCDTPNSLQTGSELRAKRRAQNANLAINASVGLLKKPRLWVGKSSSVEQTVKLICSWVSLAQGSSDAASQSSPWRVLFFGPTEHILEGDGEFIFDNTSNYAKEEDLAVSDQEEDNGGSNVDSEIVESEVDYECEDAEAIESPVPFDSDSTEWRALSFTGFCRFLVEQALPASPSATLALSDEYLPYRTACLRGFRDLLKALPQSEESSRRILFEEVGSSLISVVERESAAAESTAIKTPPVLVACSIECIAACLWKGFSREKAEALAIILEKAGGKGQPAWTVREASSLAFAELILYVEDSCLRKPSVLSRMLETATWSLQDRKFWRVRLAALCLVQALVQRSGVSSTRKVDIVLEALLPYKEDFQKLLKKALTDPEPKVTSLSSEIILQMSWWP